jgi:crotonobetaine/carnitine-CoA ligase
MNYWHKREERVLGRILEERTSENREKIFLKFRDEEFTYATMNTNANKIANGLMNMGLKKGDRVCIMLPNCPEYLFIWFGIAKTGAIEVPVNTAFKGDMLHYIINNCEAETLIVSEQYLDRIEFVADDLKVLKNIIIVSQKSLGETKLSSKFKCSSFHELLSSPASLPAVEINYWDPLAILYTSGTTGPSKGVVVPHNWGYVNASIHADACRLGTSSVAYSCLPCFHMSTQILSAYTTLVAGGTFVLAERFNAEGFWDEMRKYGVTYFLWIGAMFVRFMNLPEKPDDADNPVVVAVGAPTPEGQREKFEKRFGVRIIDIYGQTETNGISHMPWDGPRQGGCGKPSAHFEVKIFDEFDNELPLGEVGEIVCRPRSEPFCFMLGYYNMPEATLAANRNFWFHTGDRGYLDKDGFLNFADRKKEAIRRKGENISAFEVEKVLNGHPAILESAVIPIKSPMTEDEVKAVVVVKKGEKVKPEELVHYCEDRLPFFAVPRYIEFKDSLPKTATQRIEKYKLIAEGLNAATWDREKAGIKIKK